MHITAQDREPSPTWTMDRCSCRRATWRTWIRTACSTCCVSRRRGEPPLERSETGTLNNDQGLMPLTDYDTGGYPNTDHSGNYGSVDDFDDGDIDLYIAKCRQFVNDPKIPAASTSG